MSGQETFARRKDEALGAVLMSISGRFQEIRVAIPAVLPDVTDDWSVLRKGEYAPLHLHAIHHRRKGCRRGQESEE